MPQVAAVVVAAGRGLRAGGDMPKQYRRDRRRVPAPPRLVRLCQRPGRQRSCSRSSVQDDIDLVREHTRDIRLLPPVFGGATRQASVRAGLEALSPRSPDIVLVHDAARPFASADLIARAIAAAEKTGAAIPVLPVTDTVKRVDADGTVDETLDRGPLRLVQTPQAFAFAALLDAHRRARRDRAATISPTMPRWPNGPA